MPSKSKPTPKRARAAGATTVILDDRAQATIEARTSPIADRSTVIRRAIDRYQEVCRRCLPQMSHAEWMLVLDACNGTIHEPGAMVTALPLGVSDAVELDGLATKWGVNHVSLRERMGRWTYAEQLAVVDACERYWAAVSRDDRSSADALVGVVAREG